MYVNSLLLGVIFLFPITLNHQMEHPPAFLGAADETTGISTKIKHYEPDFSCGIRDEGSGVKDCLVFHGISFSLIQHESHFGQPLEYHPATHQRFKDNL